MIRRSLIFFTLFLLLSCLRSVLAGDGYTVGKNLVKNPSFEEVKDGKPVGWRFASRTYSLCTEKGSTGKNSIRFENHDPKRYDFCIQKLDLQAGAMYMYSCRIMTKDVKGPEQGMSMCIQWNGPDGKWLGGAFLRASSGVKGTVDEWTKVSAITPTIPKEAASITLSLYGRKEILGTAWFDDVEVRRYIPPFFGPMTTDCYRQQLIEGKTGVFVSVNTILGDDLSRFGFAMSVLDANGQVRMKLSPISHEKNSIRFELDADKLAVGKYRLECSALNPDSNKRETVGLNISRLDRLPERKAYIDKHRRLILDGKPFFPLGLYFGTVSPEHLEIYSKSSYNCLMPYAGIKRESLDRIHAKNIKVIYSVKDYYKGASGIKTEEEADSHVRQKVEGLKDHPAIMAWYVNDEFPLTRLRELTNRRDLMEELDPSRPTWAVLCQVNEIHLYLSAFDVVGTDSYPVALKQVREAWEWSVMTNQRVFHAKATWQVPQIFDWAIYQTTKSAKMKQRAPTFEEMRAMYWMNIAGGANGLIAYCWDALFTMDQSPSDALSSPAIRKTFEQSWKEVSASGKEVADRIPLLLSIDEPMKIKVAGQEEMKAPVRGPGNVAHRLYGQGDETWVLLVTLSEKKSVDVTLDAPVAVEVIGTFLGKEDSASNVKASGKQVSVHLRPLEPLFIGLKKAN